MKHSLPAASRSQTKNKHSLNFWMRRSAGELEFLITGRDAVEFSRLKYSRHLNGTMSFLAFFYIMSPDFPWCNYTRATPPTCLFVACVHRLRAITRTFPFQSLLETKRDLSRKMERLQDALDSANEVKLLCSFLLYIRQKFTGLHLDFSTRVPFHSF